MPLLGQLKKKIHLRDTMHQILTHIDLQINHNEIKNKQPMEAL